MSAPANQSSGLFILRLREQVNRLDDRLLVLLRQRVALARELGLLKRHVGLPLRDTAREQEVLSRLMQSGNLELPAEAIQQIFRCIIETALACEEVDAQQ